MEAKITANPPSKGQFAAFWKHNGKIWAGTFTWVEGVLFEYNTESGAFSITAENDSRDLYGQYIILEDQTPNP